MNTLLTSSLIIVLCSLPTLVTGTEEINQLTDMSESKKCLSLRSIDKIKILDEKNILFYVRGKKLYRNTLPRKCNGLRTDSIISYSVSMGQLCRLDMIRVQDRFGGSLISGASCSLGVFEQIPVLEQLKEDH